VNQLERTHESACVDEDEPRGWLYVLRIPRNQFRCDIFKRFIRCQVCS